MPSWSGVTVEQLVELCRACLPHASDIASSIEQSRFDATLTMTHGADPGRSARVSASETGWIELIIDGGFGLFTADDLATLEDYRDYIADYVALGERYLRHGAEERLSRFLRVPTRVLDPDLGPRGIAQLSLTDQFRHIAGRSRRKQ